MLKHVHELSLVVPAREVAPGLEYQLLDLNAAHTHDDTKHVQAQQTLPNRVDLLCDGRRAIFRRLLNLCLPSETAMQDSTYFCQGGSP